MAAYKEKLQLLTIIGILIFLPNAYSAEYYGGLTVGYSGGPSYQLHGKVGQFAQGFPLQVQIALAYTSLDPGKALAARRIFINDATNGDPEKSGRTWDFRLDILYKVTWFSLTETNLYFGPRYSMFKGNFLFIGGNEDFDITSDQWGWGLGLISYFPMSRQFELVLTTGADYYLSSELYGHDTTYSPDGEHVNARNDYDYGDADTAINQPKFKVRLMFGLNYHF